MKVSDYVFEYIADLGVTHVFTLPGGFSMHLNDSLNHSSLLTPVFCLHEAGAAWAATGYAKYKNGLGVCLVTSGPGSTNAITAVASAWQDSVPLLIISGDAKLENIMLRTNHQLRQGGQQDVDIEAIAGSITKYCKVMRHVAQLKAAITYAMTPRRGPAWVSIPLDVQMEVI
jgi:acetolactate synthase I/II/III large subunit